jgi:hypothetical protein
VVLVDRFGFSNLTQEWRGSSKSSDDTTALLENINDDEVFAEEEEAWEAAAAALALVSDARHRRLVSRMGRLADH